MNGRMDWNQNGDNSDSSDYNDNIMVTRHAKKRKK